MNFIRLSYILCPLLLTGCYHVAERRSDQVVPFCAMSDRPRSHAELPQIEFSENSVELTAEAMATLDQSIASARNYAGITFKIFGFSDSGESDPGLLSKKRAEIVFSYLLAKQLDAKMVSGLEWFGATRPLTEVPNCIYGDGIDVRRINRRVELSVDSG